MKNCTGIAITATAWLWCSLAGADVAAALENGTVNGNIRAQYQTWDFEAQTDERAFALGGALRAETGPIGWVRVGAGFYTAQDLDTNPDDPAKINRRLGSDLEVLGEAYLAIAQWNSSLAVGRQKIDTPFANPSDAFIVPITYEGVSFTTTAVPALTLKIDYVNAFKNRNSDEFVDVGRWSTSRLGVDAEETSGTLIVGALYNRQGLDLQAWHYRFDDLFNLGYIQAGFTATVSDTVKPFVTAQAARQKDAGTALLGKVDSRLYGLQVGTTIGKAAVVFAYNDVPEQRGSFRNGAFLSPYTFSTSPIFTNSMVETLENVGSGSATKLTLGYNFASVAIKVSHAWLNFDTAVDREATDIDVTYSMDRYLKGLSLRWRLEVVSADAEAAEFINHRFQAQYLF